jgi:hypothetical protein
LNTFKKESQASGAAAAVVGNNERGVHCYDRGLSSALGGGGFIGQNNFHDAVHRQADGVFGAVIPIVPFSTLTVVWIINGNEILASPGVVGFALRPTGVRACLESGERFSNNVIVLL